jgi:hypothetical protein
MSNIPLVSAGIQKKIYFRKFQGHEIIQNLKIQKFIESFSYDISTIISSEHDIYFTSTKIEKDLLLSNGYEFSVFGAYTINQEELTIHYKVVNIKTGNFVVNNKVSVTNFENKLRFTILNEVAGHILKAIENYGRVKLKFISISPEKTTLNKPFRLKFKVQPDDAVVRYTISEDKVPDDPVKDSMLAPEKGILIDRNSVIKLRVFSKYGVQGEIVTKKYYLTPKPVLLTHESGEYKETINVKIKENPSKAKVYYTLASGGETPENPTEKDSIFPKTGIEINLDSTIKIKTYKKNWKPGETQIFKYKIVENKNNGKQ